METIMNWRGESIQVARSKGGTLAVVDPFDNLIRAGIRPWPPPEILQKLYQSRQVRAFDGQDREAVTRTLGFYSDLQSLHSEDAITWSVFGPLAYADADYRTRFVKSLLEHQRLPVSNGATPTVWLWRRIPHPDTLVSGGPELDVGIQTDEVVVFGEAKWLSGLGQAQGKNGNKNQITLRAEFFERYGAAMFPSASHYVVLGLSLDGSLVEDVDMDVGSATLHFRSTTWESACSIDGHPTSGELRAYLDWKLSHSKIGG